MLRDSNEEVEQLNLRLKECLEKAKILYNKQSEIYCPYFQVKVTLNSDGFNHLQNKPNRMPRNINAQIRKLTLLKKGLDILPKAGTLQEYRLATEKHGAKGKDGFHKTKQVQYWGFHSLLDDKRNKVIVILKQIGDGKVIFWSVMSEHKNKSYVEGIEEN